MNNIVGFGLCTLSDEELLKKVDELTDDLFNDKLSYKQKKVLTRHIPARPNEDYDLLIGELLLRFQKYTENNDTYTDTK